MDFKLPYETRNGELKMDKFEKFKRDYIENHLPHPRYGGLTHAEGTALKIAWQESANQCKLVHPDIFEIGRADGVKQAAAEIKHLQTIIENLEMSVRSFTDSNAVEIDTAMQRGIEAGIQIERLRMENDLKEWKRHHDLMVSDKSKHYSACIAEILARIKKDSSGDDCTE